MLGESLNPFFFFAFWFPFIQTQLFGRPVFFGYSKLDSLLFFRGILSCSPGPSLRRSPNPPFSPYVLFLLFSLDFSVFSLFFPLGAVFSRRHEHPPSVIVSWLFFCFSHYLNRFSLDLWSFELSILTQIVLKCQ